MSQQQNITRKITEALAPLHLEVLNESHKHAVPPGSESHFKVVVVSDRFEGQPLVRRHQALNALLADELRGGVHALSLETLTDSEWRARGGQTLQTPDCLGGGKHDRR